jgi:hypothetical protein
MVKVERRAVQANGSRRVSSSMSCRAGVFYPTRSAVDRKTPVWVTNHYSDTNVLPEMSRVRSIDRGS